MRCIACREPIEPGDNYIEWDGFDYCGTACVVDELKKEDGLEEKVREDNRNDTGVHFPNV